MFAAADLSDYLAPLIASGETLRTEPPSDAGNTIRSWKNVSATTKIGGDSYVWKTRTEIVQVEVGTDLEWRMQAAGDRDTNWVEVAWGRHDPAGNGTIWWDVTTGATVLGLSDDLGVLEITYDDTGIEGERMVEFEVDDPLGLPRVWSFMGDYVIAWSGDLAITDDGLSYPAAIQVFHSREDGGRASGSIYKIPGVPIGFESCWDVKGDSVWMKGDGDIEGSGGPGDCTIADLFAE